MKLRRGFIKEAEEISLSLREELGLSTSEALCVFDLCDHLDIPLSRLTDVEGVSKECLDALAGAAGNKTKFFAVTLRPNGVPEILFNDLVSLPRQHSDIAHEVAHIMLGHEPHAIVGEKSCRSYDREMEREAHELGYTILVPKLSALYAVEAFASKSDAAWHFGVSQSLLNYRIKKVRRR